MPPTSDPGALNVITVTASDVSIYGFTIDGDNPLIGTDKDALRGVFANANGLTNVVVEKNIVKNLAGNGIRFQQATTICFRRTGQLLPRECHPRQSCAEHQPLGIYVRNSMYAKMTDNTINDSVTAFTVFFPDCRTGAWQPIASSPGTPFRQVTGASGSTCATLRPTL